MKFLEAVNYAQSKEELIGTNIEGTIISDVLVIPTDPYQKEKFLQIYFSNGCNSKISLAIFIKSVGEIFQEMDYHVIGVPDGHIFKGTIFFPFINL